MLDIQWTYIAYAVVAMVCMIWVMAEKGALTALLPAAMMAAGGLNGVLLWERVFSLNPATGFVICFVLMCAAGALGFVVARLIEVIAERRYPARKFRWF